MAKKKRRSFGSIRRLPSGKFQARVPDPITGESVAIGAFESVSLANLAISKAEVAMANGGWVDPRRSQIKFDAYSKQWLESHPGLRPRTKQLYEGLLRLHIAPTFGKAEIGKISTEAVRKWHAKLSKPGDKGHIAGCKAYRLLRTILNTAVQDELIARNPCVIKGAGIERSPERNVIPVAEVLSFAEVIADEFASLVLVAAFGGLRLGELQGLARRHVDVLRREVIVERQVHEMSDEDAGEYGAKDAKDGWFFGPPKSDAGVRRVSLPPFVIQALEAHMDQFTAADPDAFLFGSAEQPFNRSAVYRAWKKAKKASGVSLTPHEFRHTGNTLAAASGASLKELMARLGQNSPQAAIRYQHATRDRDHAIADALEGSINRSRQNVVPPVVELPLASGESA